MERLWFRLVSELCFDSRGNLYSGFFTEVLELTTAYPGWTLTEIKELSIRERKNWIEAAVASKKLVRN